MTSPFRHVVVFLGPTLSLERARAELDADYRPPAACGDVLRAAAEAPWAIGLADGYFERVPAVWHKEILWALDQGVHVFGAASMGALRAAELADFGMVGVGEIFAAYRSGELESDDEVALMHSPAANGYLAGSEALVNLRATFAAALEAEVISSLLHDRLVAIARDLYYPRRDFDAVAAVARTEGVADEELDALETWFPDHRVDQKAEDAIAMLREIARRRDGDGGPKETDFVFQRTEAWEELRRQVREEADVTSAAARAAASGETSPRGDWIEALRRRAPQRLALLEERAWSRLLVRRSAGVQEVDERLLADQIAEYCRRHGLDGGEELEEELQARGLDFVTFLRAMKDEVRSSRLRRILAAAWPASLEEQARLEGLWHEPAGPGDPADGR